MCNMQNKTKNKFRMTNKIYIRKQKGHNQMISSYPKQVQFHNYNKHSWKAS